MVDFFSLLTQSRTTPLVSHTSLTHQNVNPHYPSHPPHIVLSLYKCAITCDKATKAHTKNIPRTANTVQQDWFIKRNKTQMLQLFCYFYIAPKHFPKNIKFLMAYTRLFETMNVIIVFVIKVNFPPELSSSGNSSPCHKFKLSYLLPLISFNLK